MYRAAMLCFVLGLSVHPILGMAEPYRPYQNLERGREGLTPVALLVTNRSATAISCTASLAHWYTQDLGQAPPEGQIETTLWHDPNSGAFALLNPLEDRMPIEALWCGFAGRAWASRSSIALQRQVGAAQTAIELACVARDDRLDCR